MRVSSNVSSLDSNWRYT